MCRQGQNVQEDRDLQVERAAHAIAAADHLLITAGAGMGVDSDLPNYREADGSNRLNSTKTVK